MKYLILLFLTAASLQALADSCDREMTFPAHFVSASTFFREQEKYVNTDKNTLSKNGSPSIVVSPGLKTHLADLRNRPVRAFLIVDAKTDSNTMKFLSYNQISTVLSRYDLEVAYETPLFTMGWTTVELTGTSQSLFRFLNNSFARQRVMWAGLNDDGRFVQRAAALRQQQLKFR